MWAKCCALALVVGSLLVGSSIAAENEPTMLQGIETAEQNTPFATALKAFKADSLEELAATLERRVRECVELTVEITNSEGLRDQYGISDRQKRGHEQDIDAARQIRDLTDKQWAVLDRVANLPTRFAPESPKGRIVRGAVDLLAVAKRPNALPPLVLHIGDVRPGTRVDRMEVTGPAEKHHNLWHLFSFGEQHDAIADVVFARIIPDDNGEDADADQPSPLEVELLAYGLVKIAYCQQQWDERRLLLDKEHREPLCEAFKQRANRHFGIKGAYSKVASDFLRFLETIEPRAYDVYFSNARAARALSLERPTKSYIFRPHADD